jgi:hypothetical protein
MSRLQELAASIRLAYVQQRSEYESRRVGSPVVYNIPARYKGKGGVVLEGGLQLQKASRPIWESLAEKFLRLKIDPPAYISFIFNQQYLARYAPEPNQLLADKAVALWRRETSTRNEVAAVLRKVQTDTLDVEVFTVKRMNGVDEVTAIAAVLASSSVALSALFRYCVAKASYAKTKRKIFKALAKAWYRGAVLQFMKNKNGYTSYWKELLPESFVEKAEDAYERVCKLEYGV